MEPESVTSITVVTCREERRIWIQFPRDRQGKGLRNLQKFRLMTLNRMIVEHTPPIWNGMFMFCENIGEINSKQNMLIRCQQFYKDDILHLKILTKTIIYETNYPEYFEMA